MPYIVYVLYPVDAGFLVEVEGYLQIQGKSRI
jgi:hypothetical protein